MTRKTKRQLERKKEKRNKDGKNTVIKGIISSVVEQQCFQINDFWSMLSGQCSQENALTTMLSKQCSRGNALRVMFSKQYSQGNALETQTQSMANLAKIVGVSAPFPPPSTVSARGQRQRGQDSMEIVRKGAKDLNFICISQLRAMAGMMTDSRRNKFLI